MRISHRWIRELLQAQGIDAEALDPERLAKGLTELGFEVESSEAFGQAALQTRIVRVLERSAHPAKPKLHVLRVTSGDAQYSVVSAAPNVPGEGAYLVLLPPGSQVGGRAIEARDFAGVRSEGVLCSEAEIGVGADNEGLLILREGDLREGEREVVSLEASLGRSLGEVMGWPDWVLELGVTPNRSDGFGHVGIAREAALLLDRSWSRRPSSLRFQEALPVSITIEAEAESQCPRYSAALVQGLRAELSPLWMRARLHALDLRSIHTIVDITNYVMMETGHPLHAFDLSKLRGPEIRVRKARAGETMRTLDDQERKLDAEDLLICDAEGPVALAGIMGGSESAIDRESRDVLLECAVFHPSTIRRSAKRLGMHSDASHRFERGVDAEATPQVLARSLQLLEELASTGPLKAECSDVDRRKSTRPLLKLSAEKLQRIVYGARAELDAEALTWSKACVYLEALGCEKQAKSPGAVPAQDDEGLAFFLPPSWRHDLQREEDLIEEALRLYGYDRVPAVQPRLLGRTQATSPSFAQRRRLRKDAAALGLLEAVNYAFVSSADLQAAEVAQDSQALANPLSAEREVLRTSLLPGLLRNVSRAERHQVESLALFEIGRIYGSSARSWQAGGDEEGEEAWIFAFVLSGKRLREVGQFAAYDFYDAKGLLLSLLHPWLGEDVALRPMEASSEWGRGLHPKRRASVGVASSGKLLGRIGEIHPEVASKFEIERGVVYVELGLAWLQEAQRSRPRARERRLPRYPASLRDLALIVDEKVDAAELCEAMQRLAGPRLESVEVFDLYRGKPVPEGRKSLAFRLVYRDPEATLNEDEIGAIQENVVNGLLARFDASLR